MKVRRSTPATILAAVATIAAIATVPTLRHADSSHAAARIEVDDVILTAEARFLPRTLPRRSLAPAVIRARAGFDSRGPGLPRALERMKISLGGPYVRINTRGLPTCRAEQLAGTTTATARQQCGEALVAIGRASAALDRPGGGSVQAASRLLVFNGPPQDGRPTIVSHARAAFPEPETILVEAPLRVSRRGLGGFSMDVEIPEIADGRGYLTGLSARIGRTFRHRGRLRSYVTARCPVAMLPAYGRFSFAGDTVIAGTLRRYCAVRRR